MNRPPGYYKDERGREYYWDGERRSYIPTNSYQEFNEDMAPVTNCLVMGAVISIVGMILLFIVGAILEGIANTISENSGNPVGSLFAFFVVMGWLAFVVYLLFFWKPRNRR